LKNAKKAVKKLLSELGYEVLNPQNLPWSYDFERLEELGSQGSSQINANSQMEEAD